MRDTLENRGAVQAVVRQIAGRLGGGFPLDPDYATEVGRVLLTECQSLGVLSYVANDLRQFDRLPHAREIEALARKTRGEKMHRLHEGPESPCGGTGWLAVVRRKADPCGTMERDYEAVVPCSCRTNGGGK